MGMMLKKEAKGRADDIDKLVSRKLKMRRMMLGLSQQDLGKAVSVSIQQVQKYEKATNRISSGKLFAFAKYLKVPITYFYEQNEGVDHLLTSGVLAEENSAYEAEGDEKHSSDKGAVTEKEVISLIKAFSEIKSSQSRKKIIELVKSMS